MNDSVNAFVAEWNNKPLEVEDPSNRDQCMDLALGWCDALGIPREAIRHLYAYQVFTEPNDVTRQYFDLIPNSNSLVVEAGDLAVWRANGQQTGAAGHIDLGLGARSSYSGRSIRTGRVTRTARFDSWVRRSARCAAPEN